MPFSQVSEPESFPNQVSNNFNTVIVSNYQWKLPMLLGMTLLFSLSTFVIASLTSRVLGPCQKGLVLHSESLFSRKFYFFTPVFSLLIKQSFFTLLNPGGGCWHVSPVDQVVIICSWGPCSGTSSCRGKYCPQCFWASQRSNFLSSRCSVGSFVYHVLILSMNSKQKSYPSNVSNNHNASIVRNQELVSFKAWTHLKVSEQKTLSNDVSNNHNTCIVRNQITKYMFRLSLSLIYCNKNPPPAMSGTTTTLPLSVTSN